MTPYSEHQIGGMLTTFSSGGITLFDVGALDHASGRMSAREGWTRAQVWRARDWIAVRNATGSSLYIRPARELELSAWLLVDDLTAATLKEINAVRPGLVVETRPGLYQVWCRLREPVDVDTRTKIGRYLARRYGGDPGGVAGNQFGRLAGTTNRKPNRRQAGGLYPFATLRHAGGEVAVIEVAQAQSAAVPHAARAGKKKSRRRSTLVRHPTRRARGEKEDRAGTARGGGHSQSKRDFAVACRLAEYGRTDSEIAAVIRAVRGDEKAERTDYIDRTIRAARARVQRPHNPGLA